MQASTESAEVNRKDIQRSENRLVDLKANRRMAEKKGCYLRTSGRKLLLIKQSQVDGKKTKDVNKEKADSKQLG